MKPLLCICSFLLILTSCWAADPKSASDDAKAGELPLPSYAVKRTPDPIVIDGKADEAAWKKAERCSRFVLWDGKKTPDLTDCKLVWDDEALYVLFVCRDTDIQASIAEHDGDLYQEDVVEIFIDADNDEKTYMELIVNPLNTTFDNYLLRDPRDNKFSTILSWTLADWKTAATVDVTVRDPKDTAAKDKDKRWTVEMRIPFSSFVLTAGPSGKPPRPGDVWRAALTRYDRPDPKTFIHMAWSPPYSPGWPHVTRRFGKLVFDGEQVGKVKKRSRRNR